MTPRELPVPPLSGTLSRLLPAVTALVDEQTAAVTAETVGRFADENGPRIQRDLEVFAEDERDHGRSWLSAEWLSGYLGVRDPLPLSTNVSFQMNPSFLAGSGTARAAEFVHRAAAVHLAQARGETPQETDARGNEMDMDQWLCLNGGIRHPRTEEDEIRRCALDGAHREIGVLSRGRMYAVPVSDAEGNPLPQDRLLASLDAVRAAASAAEGTPPWESFGAASYLGSGVLADPLAELLENPANEAVYRRLTDLLFTVNLVEDVADDVVHLRESAFGFGHAWVYKPLSYEIGLADSWLCVHVEHSTVDGATLLAAIGRMHEVDVVGTAPDASASADEAAPEELAWELTEAAAEFVAEGSAEYLSRSRPFRLHAVTVPGLPQELPFKVSGDAAQQLLLSVTQLLAYGRIRGVYEAVDMREYQAGRTECLRPATPQAVEFARALVDHEPRERQLELLGRALEAHRSWVKACKAGSGFDRHLLGLQRAAERAGLSEPLFDDAGVRAARTDFLSTTSIGGADRIVRYAFVPSVPEGFGISYTPLPGEFEFCVSWNEQAAKKPLEFLGSLETAAGLLRRLLAEE